MKAENNRVLSKKTFPHCVLNTHAEPHRHLRREGKQRVVFVILSHYFSPLPATFLKSLLLEDASYILANTHSVPQGCVQEAARVRLPPVVCQRGSARKGGSGEKRRGKPGCLISEALSHARMEAGIRVLQPNSGRKD